MRNSRIRPLWIALVVATVALMATAANAVAAPKAVEGGELDWGVSSSFRGYVEGSPPAGQIEVSGGAAESEDGTYYRFPVVSGSYDETTGTNEVQYAGTIEYKKYPGDALHITISDLRLVLEGDEGAIFAQVSSGSTDYGVIELVELDATGVTPVTAGETLSWAAIKSALSAQAVPVFQSYPAGTAFDDVALTDSWVPTPPVAPTTVKGGDLDWGVKASWRGYIKGAGQIGVAGGAKEATDGTYVFPVVSGTYYPETETNEVQYAGSVNFSAHGGALDVTIENPKLVLEGDEGILYAHAISGSEDFGEIELVELDATGVSPVAGRETLAWNGVKSAIAAEGVPVFQNYPAGTAFDDLAFTDSWVPTPPPVEPGGGEETVTPPSKDDGLATTTTTTDTTTPAPAVTAAPRLSIGKKNLKVEAGGLVKVATLACPAGGTTCTTKAPKHLAVKIDGKRYVLTVLAPKSIGAGKSAAIKVQLPKAARTALGAKKLAIKFKVSLEANGTSAKRVVKVQIAGRK